MHNEDYKNRELDEKFNAADEKIETFQARLMERLDTFEGDVRNSLTRIELQTAKTNGRVTKLERWQGMVMGYCACLTMLVVPLLIIAGEKYFAG